MARWTAKWFALAFLPFVCVGVLLGFSYAGLRLVSDPIQYDRPASLFFPEHQTPQPPIPHPPKPPKPPPTPEPPPLNEYVAEGRVDEEVQRSQISGLEYPGSTAVASLVDATTSSTSKTTVKKARHLALVISIDDSGSMREPGHDPRNDRYQVVQQLLEKLGNGDRVLLARTDEAPVFSSAWLSPSEAKATIDEVLSRTGFGMAPYLDSAVFDRSGPHLEDVISQGLSEVPLDQFNRTLIFLGDGDPADFGYQQGISRDAFKSEEITMSGVIFGPDAADLNGENNFLVKEALETGGEVKGAQDTTGIAQLLKGFLEKAKKSTQITRILRVRFKTPDKLKQGDFIWVTASGKRHKLEVQ